MLNFGILGNNARNLHYIKKWNPRKSIRLADNKLQTKQFLGERGIPFAQTYAVLSSRAQLADFDFSALPHRDFVLKPNHGSKGKGIAILKAMGKGPKPEVKSSSWFLWMKFRSTPVVANQPEEVSLFISQGKTISEQELKRQIIDILDGKHSLIMVDEAIIEEKLIPGDGFKEFCEFGLADLRLIVFNLVPVAAMIRIPTAQSGGKANLNAGGIGCGIDIGSGKITSMLYNNKIYTSHFPAEFAHYQGRQIPFWNDILLYSSKVQYFVNLGYLALDWVVTDQGPKLLEINARAGLEVQKIANIRLKSVLQKLADLKVQDPEKGVTIAKALFSKDESDLLRNNKVLYLSQTGKLKITTPEGEEVHSVLVEVDLSRTKNRVSPDIAQRITQLGAKSFQLYLPDNDLLFNKLKYDLGVGENKIILGQKTASQYFVKPVRKESLAINILNPKKIVAMETAELHLIDDTLEKLSKRFNISARLRPVNYFAELDRFISAKGEYNPVFDYKFPSLALQDKRYDELSSFYEKLATTYLKSPIISLFQEKTEEIIHRAKLLRAYTEQDFATIEQENIALFGSLDLEFLKISKEKVLEPAPEKPTDTILEFGEIYEYCERYLAEKGMFGVEVVKNTSSFSRMSVLMGKSCKLNISPTLTLTEPQLRALLAHEIDIHLVRYLNGKKSGWNIFKSGTGYYLKDEEGLAVWNARRYWENRSMYKKFYLLAESKSYTFQQMKDLIYILYPTRSLEGIFKTVLRSKKGLIYTGNITGIYAWMKDKVYLDGYEKIKNLNLSIKEFEILKKGKIKTKDMDFII